MVQSCFVFAHKRRRIQLPDLPQHHAHQCYSALSLVIKWKLRQGQLRTRPCRQRLFHSSCLHVGLDASRDHVYLLTSSFKFFLLQTRHVKLCVIVESVLWLLHIAQRILGVLSLVLILDS